MPALTPARLYKPSRYGYAIHIDNDYFQYIGLSHCSLQLGRLNQKRARCKKCNAILKPEEGIYLASYGEAGYLCIRHAKAEIHKYGGKLGFVVNMIGNLQACFISTGKYSAKQICNSLIKIEAGK